MASPPPPLVTYLLPALEALEGALPRVALDAPFGFEGAEEPARGGFLRHESGLTLQGALQGAAGELEERIAPLIEALSAHRPLGALVLGALPEDEAQAERWTRALAELLAEGGLMAIALPAPRKGWSGIWARAMSIRAPASRRAREPERLCEPLLAARLHRVRLHRSEAGTLAWGRVARRAGEPGRSRS